MEFEFQSLKFGIWNMETEIQNLKFGTWKSGIEIWNLKLGNYNLEFKIWDLKFGIWNSDFDIRNLKFGVWNFGILRFGILKFGIWKLRCLVPRFRYVWTGWTRLNGLSQLKIWRKNSDCYLIEKVYSINTKSETQNITISTKQK